MVHATKKILAVLLLALVPVAARAEDRLYDRILRSTGWVIAGDSAGSGVLVDSEAKILVTTYHVVQEAKSVVVCFPTQNEKSLIVEAAYYRQHLGELGVKGHVTAIDPRRDLALVQLESIPDSVQAIPLAKVSPAPGDRVHSVGNPGASQALWVYTSGTVRQVYALALPVPLGYVIEAQAIETQSPVNPGDSGGPAVNEEGELVGIVVSYLRDAQLVSHCIEVSELKDLLAGHNKTVDHRVQQALTTHNLRYTVSPLGVFKLVFGASDKPDTLVVVSSSTERWGAIDVRDIRVPVFVLERPLPERLVRALLTLNGRYKLGAWSTREVTGKNIVEFVAHIDANADAQQLHDAIKFAVALVSASRDDLTSLATPPGPPIAQIAGVWHADLAVDHEHRVSLQLTFASDGTFTWDESTAVFRGKYDAGDGSFAVVFNGKPKRLATVRTIGEGEMTVQIGDQDVVFHRSETEHAQAESPESIQADKANGG